MVRLTILHTNDIHGNVEQLARIATLAKRIRGEVQARGDYCVLWDAGDVEDPTLFESQMTKGSAAMALLRAAGYDLSALGNASPLRYGQQVVAGLAEAFGQPLLCANMLESSGQLVAGLAPYTIQTFGKLKVGIIGMTAPMSFYSLFKLRMVDPLAMLPDLIHRVRAEGVCTVALLSHLGFALDRMQLFSKEDYADDQKIAEQVTGLDLIVGGHSHTELRAPVMVKDTLIAQVGDRGRFLGQIDLHIDEATGKIARHHGELIPVVEEIPPDPDFQAAYKAEQDRVQQITERVVGELRETIDWADDRQCAAGNLAADVLLDRVKGAEVAFALAGHWRSGMTVGKVTVGSLTAAMRSSANPARVYLTGDQILQFLSTALKPENAARKPRPLRGVSIGMPHVAGMTVRYDSVLLDCLDVRIQGEPLRADRRYCVAGTDVEFSNFVNYLAIPEDQIEYEIPIILPEVMQEYLSTHSPLCAPLGNRIVSL